MIQNLEIFVDQVGHGERVRLVSLEFAGENLRSNQVVFNPDITGGPGLDTDAVLSE